MNNCANCTTTAAYSYEGIFYCEKDLPSFLRKPENTHLVIVLGTPGFEETVAAPVEEPVVEAPKSKKKNTSDAPAEETIAPAEEPNP